MNWIGMIFVGAMMGLVAWRCHPAGSNLPVRVWLAVGALSAVLSGFLGQALAGFNVGSMRGTLIVLLGTLLILLLAPLCIRK